MPDSSVYVCFPEVELPLKKDGFTSESTTLEALLRGEGVEKKVDAREEESIQEIQVVLPVGSPWAPPPAASVPWGPCDTVARKLRASKLKASLHPRSNHRLSPHICSSPWFPGICTQSTSAKHQVVLSPKDMTRSGQTDRVLAFVAIGAPA